MIALSHDDVPASGARRLSAAGKAYPPTATFEQVPVSNTAVPVNFRPDVRPARLPTKQIAKPIAVALPPRHDRRGARHISRKTLDSHHHSLSFHLSDGISVPDCRLQRRLRRRKFTRAALASIRRRHTLCPPIAAFQGRR